MKRWWVLGCVLIMATSGAAVAKGQAKPKPAAVAPPAEAPVAEEVKAEPEAPPLPKIVGPQRIELGHHAQIDLPAGMALFEQQAAQELMTKSGNSTHNVVAVIVPQVDNATWWVAIHASDDGYVEDNDADELDGTSMLANLKQGTLEQNKTRVTMGVPELFIDDWREAPRYQPALHHLVWGINGHDSQGKVVNFSTRFLGRNGFLSVNLIDGPETIAQSQTQALAILTAVHFAPGFRYEDHVGSDHSSGMGLKALVLGGTAVVLAKKTGILIAILLALKKGIIVIAVAVGAFFKRIFGGGKKPEPSNFASTEMEPPSGEPPSDLDPPGPPTAG
ncbi:MAG: DUF2167 domain-containing protein [Kofleriaceae bacterium]